MANYSASRAKHATLGGTTQDMVTLTVYASAVEILNRAGDAPISVRAQWSTAPTDIASALEDDTEVVPAGGFVRIAGPAIGTSPVIVKLKGTDNEYSVIGVS